MILFELAILATVPGFCLPEADARLALAAVCPSDGLAKSSLRHSDEGLPETPFPDVSLRTCSIWPSPRYAAARAYSVHGFGRLSEALASILCARREPTEIKPRLQT